jgi:hypothetical protein
MTAQVRGAQLAVHPQRSFRSDESKACVALFDSLLIPTVQHQALPGTGQLTPNLAHSPWPKTCLAI